MLLRYSLPVGNLCVILLMHRGSYKCPVLVAAGFPPRRIAEAIACVCNALETRKTRKLKFAATT